MSISCKNQAGMIVVMGHTFPHKESIKLLGGRFNPALKTWELPFNAQAWTDISTLCKSTGGGVIGDDTETQPLDPIPPTVNGPSDQSPGGPASSLQKKLESLPPQLQKMSGEIPKAIDIRQPEASTSSFTSKISFTGGDSGLSVGQLVILAAQKISEAFPTPLWVVGEVQNMNFRGQTAFLSLADGIEGKNAAATQSVNATIWPSSFAMLNKKYGEKVVRDILSEGMKVRVLCQVSLYKQRGQLSVSINDLDSSFTKGDLALRREALIKELKQKGLYTANKQTRLSVFPFKVGLISSEGSRAQSDFTHQLTDAGFCGTVIFKPTSMQGDKVPSEVVAAIRQLSPLCDVIVLTRGGGSAADLRWFDSKEIAYEIAACKTPIISAIGHHDDTCVAEEVSYAFCKTPTAAAEYIKGIFEDTLTRIEELSRQLANTLNRCLGKQIDRHHLVSKDFTYRVLERMSREKARLDRILKAFEGAQTIYHNQMDTKLLNLSHKLEQRSMSAINTTQSSLMRIKAELESATVEALTRFERGCDLLHSKLVQSDPIPWMTKGWTQVFIDSAKDGKKSKTPTSKVFSVKSLHKKDLLKIRLRDGVVNARIESINHRE